MLYISVCSREKLLGKQKKKKIGKEYRGEEKYWEARSWQGDRG
jgi:hypothetical protein